MSHLRSYQDSLVLADSLGFLNTLFTAAAMLSSEKMQKTIRLFSCSKTDWLFLITMYKFLPTKDIVFLLSNFNVSTLHASTLNVSTYNICTVCLYFK